MCCCIQETFQDLSLGFQARGHKLPAANCMRFLWARQRHKANLPFGTRSLLRRPIVRVIDARPLRGERRRLEAQAPQLLVLRMHVGQAGLATDPERKHRVSSCGAACSRSNLSQTNIIIIITATADTATTSNTTATSSTTATAVLPQCPHNAHTVPTWKNQWKQTVVENTKNNI